jgi:hypothetical protein
LWFLVILLMSFIRKLIRKKTFPFLDVSDYRKDIAPAEMAIEAGMFEPVVRHFSAMENVFELIDKDAFSFLE